MKNILLSNISIFGFSHMLVDAVCAWVVFFIFSSRLVAPETFVWLVIAYNVLAFALQPFFGLIADIYRIPAKVAAIGLLLSAFSVIIIRWPIFCVAVAGIGNAMFHVGGGIIALNLQPRKAAMPGIYVSTGAIGLFIGGFFGLRMIGINYLLLILSFIMAALIVFIRKPKIYHETKIETAKGIRPDFRWYEAGILLLLVSICIRGLVGLSLALPWKQNLTLLILLTLVIALGKAMGGILGDRFGWKTVALAGLGLSIPLLSFFQPYPIVIFLGAFFFNLTMPITLTSISNMMPGRAGFAFGLTTLALIIGALPTYTTSGDIFHNNLILFAVLSMSLAGLFFGLKIYFRFFLPKDIKIKKI